MIKNDLEKSKLDKENIYGLSNRLETRSIEYDDRTNIAANDNMKEIIYINRKIAEKYKDVLSKDAKEIGKLGEEFARVDSHMNAMLSVWD